MAGHEWLLRCRTCGLIFASVFVPIDGMVTWESGSNMVTCHPNPNGSPGLDAVVRGADPLKIVRQWMGVEEAATQIQTCVVFRWHDGKRMWSILGKP